MRLVATTFAISILYSLSIFVPVWIWGTDTGLLISVGVLIVGFFLLTYFYFPWAAKKYDANRP